MNKLIDLTNKLIVRRTEEAELEGVSLLCAWFGLKSEQLIVKHNVSLDDIVFTNGKSETAAFVMPCQRSGGRCHFVSVVMPLTVVVSFFF